MIPSPAPRRDRIASAQPLRFEPSYFQQVRQQDKIFRRRHLRQLRRHCGNIVGDVMIRIAALISHDFARDQNRKRVTPPAWRKPGRMGSK